jgi:hypothetical protein
LIYAFVKTAEGKYQRYTYTVTSKTQVNPDNTSILTKNPNGTLFLSACGDDEYVWSLKARNIVIAELVGEAGVEMDTIIPAVVYDEEIKEAYTWAKEEWVTTQPTINDARMFDTLTRGELAKMMVEWKKGRGEGEGEGSVGMYRWDVCWLCECRCRDATVYAWSMYDGIDVKRRTVRNNENI